MLVWEAHYLNIRSFQLSPQHPLKVRTSVKTVWNSPPCIFPTLTISVNTFPSSCILLSAAHVFKRVKWKEKKNMTFFQCLFHMRPAGSGHPFTICQKSLHLAFKRIERSGVKNLFGGGIMFNQSQNKHQDGRWASTISLGECITTGRMAQAAGSDPEGQQALVCEAKRSPNWINFYHGYLLEIW